MIEQCMLCGSKSGIIENNVCIVCKYKLSDYMKRQDAQIQQHRHNIQCFANPDEILKEWEQIDAIYQDMQDIYCDKGIDPISLTHPGSTLKELREECWGEIEKYKNKTFAATTQETPDIGLFCKYCGKPIDSDSKFCKFCGKQLSSDDTTPATAIPHQEAPQEVQKPLPETTPPQINFSSQPESTSPTPQYQTSSNCNTSKKGSGCTTVFLIGFCCIFLFILIFAGFIHDGSDNTVSQSPSTEIQESTTIDYQKVGHDYSIVFIKLYIEEKGISNYSRLGWYYPENYSIKDGVHYTSSKFDYNNTDHPYVIGLKYDENNKPYPVYFSVDDEVRTYPEK